MVLLVFPQGGSGEERKMAWSQPEKGGESGLVPGLVSDVLVPSSGESVPVTFLSLLPLTLIEASAGNKSRSAHPCSVAWSTLVVMLGKDLELEKVHLTPWQLGLLTLS